MLFETWILWLLASFYVAAMEGQLAARIAACARREREHGAKHFAMCPEVLTCCGGRSSWLFYFGLKERIMHLIDAEAGFLTKTSVRAGPLEVWLIWQNR